MKSADFLNSLGHSCIRSGTCAFPMQRVNFVFEGGGKVELEVAILRTCTLFDPRTQAEHFPQVFSFLWFS